jgi:hypothetical protein
MRTVRLLLLGITSVVGVYAQTHTHGHGDGTGTRVVGTVVDIACFVGHDSSGAKHAKCAEACARAGNSLGIYDADSKTLYVPVSMDHKNPNTKLLPLVEKKVAVTGRVMEKAGLKGIAVETVEAVQ